MADPQNPNPSPSKPLSQQQQEQQQDRDFPPLIPLPLPLTLAPNLRSFDSSVGLRRKAFRLGKFVQDLNSLRFASPSSSSALALTLLAYCGEGIYYFVEQLVWLSKTGLISSTHAKRLSKISAWAELVGYLGQRSASSVFTYYTFWPFVDEDHFIHKYFLPYEFAILIPVLAGVALLSFLSVFVGLS